MRRIDWQATSERRFGPELFLIVALAGAALAFYGLGDQIFGALGDLIANIHAA